MRGDGSSDSEMGEEDGVRHSEEMRPINGSHVSWQGTLERGAGEEDAEMGWRGVSSRVLPRRTLVRCAAWAVGYWRRAGRRVIWSPRWRTSPQPVTTWSRR